MFSLLVEYSAQDVRAAETVTGPSWWMGLMRKIAHAYRIRRAVTQMSALDHRMLRDLGLDRAGIEHAVRFGRA